MPQALTPPLIKENRVYEPATRIRPSTIAVDFDGVIHAYSKGWHDGTIYDEALPGALDGLRSLMTDHAVFIFTSRDAAPVAAWLSERGFTTVIDVAGPTHQRVFWNDMGRLLVTDRKLPAVAYLDDRGVRFRDWDQALADLASRL